MTDYAASPSRRGVLAAGTGSLLAIGLSSCRHDEDDEPTAVPGGALLETALTAEAGLIAAYDAALAAQPRLRRTLERARADHLVHHEALLAAGARTSASPRVPPPVRLPRSALGIRRAIATAEAAAADDRGRDCLRAPRRLAPLLASLAASEAGHAAVLRGRV